MRLKPPYLSDETSDAMWARFNHECDNNNVGDKPEDWDLAWVMFYAGYEFRRREVQ